MELFFLLKLNYYFLYIATGKNNCSWLDIIEVDHSFSCCVCKLYHKVVNENNAFYKGCKKWHRNYPMIHCNKKLKVRLYSLYQMLFFYNFPTLYIIYCCNIDRICHFMIINTNMDIFSYSNVYRFFFLLLFFYFLVLITFYQLLLHDFC